MYIKKIAASFLSSLFIVLAGVNVAVASMFPGSFSGGSFCDKVENMAGGVKQNTEEQMSQKKRIVSDERSSQDDKLASRRQQQNQKREVHFQSLVDIAETEEQKSAVEKFKEKVNLAVVEFQATQSAIVDEFRMGMDSIFKESFLSGPKLERKGELEDIIEDAKERCQEDDVDEDEIAEEFMEKMKDAGAERPSSRNKTNKQNFSLRTNENAIALKKQKKDAFSQAKNELKAKIEVAKEDLKKIFG